jgi:membrane-bound lytic murein transglycosylase D
MPDRSPAPLRVLPAALCLLALLAGAPLLRAAPETARVDTESYLTDWARTLADELDLGNLQLPSEEDLRDLGKQFDAYLASGSLDDIAWVLPEAREALAICDTVPDLKPYADWLRQRMDYLELASKLVRLYPPEKPLPPFPRPDPAARFTLPKPPPPPPVTAAMMVKREAAVRNRDVWRKTLLDRPIPGDSIKLVPVVKKVFEAEGLPHQLVWIAEVESTFNPSARSPAGAMGLFQLMPETAERLGLRLSPIDQRRSPELCARAAARYLRFLFDEFGSWSLALAGYNAGEGRVGRALDRSKKTSYDAIASSLPLETRLYVPKVLALIELREKIDPLKLPAPKPAKP